MHNAGLDRQPESLSGKVERARDACGLPWQSEPPDGQLRGRRDVRN